MWLKKRRTMLLRYVAVVYILDRMYRRTRQRQDVERSYYNKLQDKCFVILRRPQG